MTKDEWLERVAYCLAEKGRISQEKAKEWAPDVFANSVAELGDEQKALSSSPDEAVSREIYYWEPKEFGSC